MSVQQSTASWMRSMVAQAMEMPSTGCKKQVPPPEGPLSMRQKSFESGRPWFAVPPGKGNGREHQDLRRRHLLVRDRQRPPHFDTSPRSGRYETFRRSIERFINPTLAFFTGVSLRRAWSDSHAHSHAPAFRAVRRQRSGTRWRQDSGLLGLTEPSEKLAVRRELLLRLGTDAGWGSRRRRRPRLARTIDGQTVRFR